MMRLKRLVRLILIVLVLFFVVGSSTAVLADDDTPDDVVTVTPISGAVNVRSGPGLQFILRGTLQFNFILIATGRNDYEFDFTCTGNPASDNDAWLRVVLIENLEGWVNLCVVEVEGEDTSLPVSEPSDPELIEDYEEVEEIDGTDFVPENPDFASVTLGEMIVRDAPSLNGEILGSIPEGVTVELLARTYLGGWIKIRYGDVEGWVPNFMVTVSPEQLDELPVYVSLQGVIEAIVGNFIIVFGVPIEVENPGNYAVGMIIFIDGTSEPGEAVGAIIIITIVIVEVGEGNGDCSNGPPPWAPAHGWRRRCEGQGQ
jgi:uncharacterized protein YraI